MPGLPGWDRWLWPVGAGILGPFDDLLCNHPRRLRCQCSAGLGLGLGLGLRPSLSICIAADQNRSPFAIAVAMFEAHTLKEENQRWDEERRNFQK
ncbi:hypothetical protein TorRG33x02_118560 [Trema orientale]|uniref:Uncharacterized protein n=1 Tax=Trema orientale TaxID=63057 RepID=A0A2P5F3J2_TREOI|nr:hypothetical protein TorRG33x02_118560 [Trema orientale]